MAGAAGASGEEQPLDCQLLIYPGLQVQRTDWFWHTLDEWGAPSGVIPKRAEALLAQNRAILGLGGGGGGRSEGGGGGCSGGTAKAREDGRKGGGMAGGGIAGDGEGQSSKSGGGGGGGGFGAPPSFVCAASDDDDCPCATHTDPYVAALRARRIPVTYVRRRFGGHGFGLTGGWTGAAPRVQGAGERSLPVARALSRRPSAREEAWGSPGPLDAAADC